MTKRESAKNFKVFADKLGKNLPENSETLFSLMSELDKLYTSLIDVTRSQTKAFNSLKLRLFVKWVALQNSQYTSLSSLDEVKSIKGKYNELCKIGIDQTPNAALLLAAHLDSLETIMQLAVEHRNDSLRVAQAKQRVEDSLAAIPTSLLLSQAHDLMTSQYFKKALVAFRKFTDAYSIIPAAQRLFIDTSGLNSSISESFYQLANAYFYGIDVQKNIPEALKYFQSSRNYGNPVVDDKIVLCRLIAQEASSRQTSVKFKGFYIGMSLSEATGLIDLRYSSIFGKVVIKESVDKDKYRSYSFESASKAVFVFDNSLLLAYLFWPGDVVNKMFEVTDLSAEQFAKEFVNSYNIPKMTAESDDGSYGIASASVQYWEYVSPDGVRIRIYAPGQASFLGLPIALWGKDIRLERVPTRGSRSFD